MGLTYDGGANLLKYIYNSDDELGVEKNGVPALYNNFTIELRKSDGSPYEGVTVALPRGSQSIGEPVWNINGNIVTNASDLTFSPKATSGSDTINTFNVYLTTLANQSILFATGTLNTPITVQQGETPIIRAYDSQTGDGITIDFDNVNSGRYTPEFIQKINDYVFLGQDSLASVNQYRFIIIDSNGQQTPLDFYVSRTDFQDGNWDISNISGYAQAQNKGDLVLPLNDTNASISTNTIDFFYGEGDIGNQTFTKAGRLGMTQLGNDTPASYQIADGETARLKAGELRINSK